MLVRIIKNWAAPDLMRQTPEISGVWEGITFTCNPIVECDVVFVLNSVPEPSSLRCPPDNIWALMQEPYITDVFDWMIEGHGQYAHVFSHHLPQGFREGKYVRCQPALPWHINRTYDELKLQEVPDKQKDLSWITSNLTSFPGHKVRMGFLDYLRAHAFPVEVYGKGIQYIEDKWDGLAPYRYSLAIENFSGPDYWTEKIADCFLSWTVPIYYGCTNLEDYFPDGSFIRIDITRPQEALEIIKEAITTDDWTARLLALQEARELVLDKYQFFPLACDLIRHYRKNAAPENIVLQPYRDRRVLLKKIRRRISRLLAGV